MRSGSGRPSAYPLAVAAGAVAVCAVWAPFGTADQLAALAAVALGIVGYTGFQLALGLGVIPVGFPNGVRTARVTRLRQQHRLVSRSWLQMESTGGTRWLPVHFDRSLPNLVESDAELVGNTIRVGGRRMYPSGRCRRTEPTGRLIDNPSRPADPPDHATETDRFLRRLLLDFQPAVAAPFAGLLWIYVDGGSLPIFLAATTVAAAAATWLSAVRGSDPT